jgi:hypothetical protein
MKSCFALFLTLLMSAIAVADDFQTFEARPFGRVDAERLADAEFQARHGACGMVIFKERRFEAWIFETRIGYAGGKGPDLIVFSTRVSDPLEMFSSQGKPAPLPQHPAEAAMPVDPKPM